MRTPLLLRWPDGFGRGQVFPHRVSWLDYMPTLLAAAGAEIPEHLGGRDLRTVVAGNLRNQPPLFWESGNSERHAWAVLSGDGRWRLSRFFVGDVQLNDLTSKPAGDVNVAGQHPEVVADLQQEFIRWRHRQRRLAITYEPLDDGGRAVLGGASLQRAPGYGGHTFAIGVTPASTVKGDPPGVIARQAGYWELQQSGDRLLLEIGTLRLEAPAPPAGACAGIIVTSQFDRELQLGSERGAVAELYVNGQRVASTRVRNLAPPPDDYLQATWIGQDESGGRPYAGRLGKPLLLDERLRDDAESDPGVANGVSWIEGELCPP